jgi:hypothetical protein
MLEAFFSAFRVRHNRADKVGRVTLRYLSRLHHIRVGRAPIGEPVRLLVANKHIRVIRDDGSLLRELTLDPTCDYQPLGTPPGRPGVSTISCDRCPRCPETGHWLGSWDSNPGMADPKLVRSLADRRENACALLNFGHRGSWWDTAG